MCKHSRFGLLIALIVVGVVLGSPLGVAAQTPAPPAAPAAALDGALISRIQSEIEKVMQAQQIPGFAIGVIKDRQVAYMKGFGVAEAGTDRAVTPQTVFLLACTSKPATATAVMQLKAQGKLDLGERVTTYLPYFRIGKGMSVSGDYYKDITVRHLLANRSGLPFEVDENGPDDGSDDDGVLERHVRRLESATAFFKPGEAFQYSNPGFHVLGDVIAKVSGQTFEAYVQEHIFTPLGMRHTTFLPREVDPGLLAAPHALRKWVAVKSDSFPYAREDGPAGGMCSNVEDMLRWARAHLDRGRLDGVEILPKSAYDDMWLGAQPTTDMDDVGKGWEKYGLGWCVSDLSGHLVVGHGGRPDGGETALWIAPDDGAAVVVLANRDPVYFEVMKLGYQVLRWVVGVPE